jgi:hypothetical protein
MTKSKALNAVRKSPASIISNTKNARKFYDKTWSIAARAPMFCKISKKSNTMGNTKHTYRTTRLIGSHAYNIAASGAALNASRIAEGDCKRLRLDFEHESRRTPWLPSVSKGACMVLEQFLCALAQEAALKGHYVREGSGNSMRLAKQHIKVGWDTVFDSVFRAASLMPKTFCVLPEHKVKSVAANIKEKKERKNNKTEDEDECEPPEEDIVGDAADLEIEY